MNIVEGIGFVKPIAFYIINHEADILRNPDSWISNQRPSVTGSAVSQRIRSQALPGRLYGRQVGPGHNGVWKSISHLNGPEAGSCADVEDPPGVLKRCKVQFAVEEEGDDMVL